MKKYPEKCTIYLVRHGETEANIKKLVCGQYESDLTKNGINQAKKRAKTFKNVNFDGIYSSDFKRAIKTAEILSKKKRLTIRTSPLLRERNYGRFEGKKESEYRSSIGHAIDALKALPDKKRWSSKLEKTIESDAELMTRFQKGLKKIAVKHFNKNVLIVAHEACIRTFLIGIGFANYEQIREIKNCGYAKIIYDGTKFMVKKITAIKMETSKPT